MKIKDFSRYVTENPFFILLTIVGSLCSIYSAAFSIQTVIIDNRVPIFPLDFFPIQLIILIIFEFLFAWTFGLAIFHISQNPGMLWFAIKMAVSVISSWQSNFLYIYIFVDNTLMKPADLLFFCLYAYACAIISTISVFEHHTKFSIHKNTYGLKSSSIVIFLSFFIMTCFFINTLSDISDKIGIIFIFSSSYFLFGGIAFAILISELLEKTVERLIDS